QSLGIAAHRAHRVAQRDAVGVRRVQLRLVEQPGGDATAEVRRVVPKALLVDPRDDLDRGRRVLEQLDGLERHEDAERTVVAPGVAHGVDVRTDQERGPRRGYAAPIRTAHRDLTIRQLSRAYSL